MNIRLFMAILFFAIAGCTTFHGLEPIKPKYVDKTKDVMPTFKWKPAEKENVKYDFIIYEAVPAGGLRIGDDSDPGKALYYREGLDKPEHTVEKPLAPGEKYYWSVRVRESEKIGPWSVFGPRSNLFQIWIEKR